MDINTLKTKIEEANLLYRSGNPIMSDLEYDELVDKLFQLSPNDIFFKNIGHKIYDRKVKLPIQMASMNKIKTIQELNDWFRLKSIPLDTILVLTPKYDGISLGVNENTKTAFTRGDGEYGQESTKHFSVVSNKIDKSDNLFEYSYGELIMSKNKFNSKYSNDFINQRNLVAGLINSKKSSNILSDCEYIRYGIQNFNENKFNSKVQILNYLNSLQETKVPYETCNINDISEEFIINIFKKWSSDFEIDGIIIEVNELNTQLMLGRETSSNNPIWARAFKHTSFEQSVLSEVLNITWNISKNGCLKPVINIRSVHIDGVTVSNVTGNNARYIKEMGIGIGSIVKVVRSGMVIPKIIEVLEKKEFSMPNIDNISWDEKNIDLITLNETDEQKFKKIVAFFSILETDNVSEGILKQLWDNGFKSIKDILYLKKNDLLSIGRFGNRKAEIVYDSIQKSITNVELAKLQHATGIFKGLGSLKLVKLEHFKTKPSVDDVMSIEGFAEISAKTYVESYDEFFDFIKDLPITFLEKSESITISNDLEGMVFVFTGLRMKLEEDLLIIKGAKIGSSVSKNTTHLVCKDKNITSSKLEKAKEFGIIIMNVDEFMLFLHE